MNIQWILAWRYLSGRKLRTVLTTLAVVFGVLVLFGMNIILPTMINALQVNMKGAAGVVDFSITQSTGESFAPEVLPAVESVDGVRAVTASLKRVINLPADFFDNDPAKTDVISTLALIGVDPQTAATVRAYPVNAGHFLTSEDTNAAVISQTLANVLDIAEGDAFTVPSAEGIYTLTVAGILPARAQAGNEEVIVPLATAQTMTQETGRINTIDVNIDPGADESRREEIGRNLETVLGDRFLVGTALSGTELFASLQMGQIAINMFGVLALFMGGFIIFNTFRTVVAERRRDIGMLRALGANRRTILGMILLEGLLQGVLGTTAGLILGYLLGAGVLQVAGPILNQFIHLQIGSVVVSPYTVGFCILLGVGTTVLAGWVPARNASRVTPMDALRPSVAEVEYRRQAGRGSILGMILVALASIALLSGNAALIVPGSLAFLVGLILVAPMLVRPISAAFGSLFSALFARQGTGTLAQGSLTRQPARVAVTASTILLGLAVIVAAGGMVASLSHMLGTVMHRSLGSDYLFVPPSISLWSSDIGAGPLLTERLRAIDGVGDISTLRFAASRADGVGVSLLGIDPVVFPRVGGLEFLQGNGSEAYQALREGRAMIVNGAFLSTSRKSVGDTVELQTADGTVPYRIIALGTDLLNAKVTTAYISQADMLADFGKAEDVFIQLNLVQGTDAGAADRQIREVAADFPQFTVISGTAYVNSMLAQLEVAFSAMYILFAFLALPSLFAMINTLAISVIERTREIGMIRAIGATRGQVRTMILAEALLLAAVGVAFGLLGGLYLGYTFVVALGTLFPIDYYFPLNGILAAVGFGLLFGALAAVIPARQAAKLDIIEALHYE
jgi:putative ABC transport system permease protein